MSAPEQLRFTERCRQCGRDLRPLDELAAVARRARVALDGMRLAVPDDLSRGVRDLDADLACHVGRCTARSA